MPWTSVLWLIARVALRVLADELDPAGRRRRPRKGASRPKPSQSKEAPPQARKAPPRPSKEAPPQPKKEQARPRKAPSEPPPQAEPAAPYATPQSAESAGWGVRTEPQPVPVLRIETDTGSTVSPLSVIGDRAYVAPRAQRERQAGESRRARRKTEPMPAMLPRTPEMVACMARMRARASGAAPALEQFGAPAVPEQPAAPPRRRRPRDSRAITFLTPTTLRLLASGEPLMPAARAA